MLESYFFRGKIICHANSNFEISHVIGKGGFAVVFKARDLSSLEDVAIKIMEKASLGKVDYRKEVEVHSRLSHENIVTLYDAWSDSEFVYIVTEYCAEGDLKQILSRRSHPFKETEARKIIYQIAQGIKYLHANEVIHRDIKMENIFMKRSSTEFRCKIGDFGLASCDIRPKTHQTLCGTPSSIAPEVANRSGYSKKVDVWGLGVILYTILVGSSPFDDGHFKSTMDNVIHRNPHLPKTLSPDAIHLINGMLQKSEGARLNIHDVLSHGFLNSPNMTGDSGICSSGLASGHTSSLAASLGKARFPEIRQPLSELSDIRPLSRARSAASNLMHPSNPSYENFSPIQAPVRPRGGSVDRLFVSPVSEAMVKASPQLSPRLNTERLRPMSNPQEIKTGVKAFITSGGEVQMEFQITKKSGKSSVERMTVSSNGDAIRIERRSAQGSFPEGDWQDYNYVTLPRSYFQKYNVAAKYVQSIREKLPKVTLYTRTAECKLMENEPEANFKVVFYDGPTVFYESKRNKITFEMGGNGEVLYFSYPLTVSQQEEYPHLKAFNDFHLECKEHVSFLDSKPLSVKFPVIFGRKERGSQVERREPLPLMSSTLSVSTANPGTTRAQSTCSLTSCSVMVTDKGSGVKEYSFQDGCRVVMDISKGKPFVFTFYDTQGKSLTRRADQVMPDEMKNKVTTVLRFIKSRSGKSLSSLRS